MPSIIDSPIVLGIETSCDDTAAAVVARGRLRSSVVQAQSVHTMFGGVVPELASRDHERRIGPVVRQALSEAGTTKDRVDAVAVTYGPGLAGSLLVGLSFAKALSWALDRPIVGVNHLEGHLFSLFLGGEPPPVPFLCLVVSGGHTQLVRVDGDFRYETLGKTRDDAAGEAFDKVGKLLGLPYPAGPWVDRLAREGDPTRIRFPRSSLEGYDFSFSGLKTAVLYHLDGMNAEERADRMERGKPDLCASFEAAVIDMLVEPLERACRATGIRHVAVAGGVSANSGLRGALSALSTRLDLSLHVPDPAWTADNAAMIAMAGYHRLLAGHTSDLSLTAQPSLAL